MALFKRFSDGKPPDRLREISERVYVFDCCFSTEVLEEDEYKSYMGGIVAELHDYYPDSSFMVFNFREGDKRTQISDILSQYDMTVMEYPLQYERCPMLPLEMIHHFLQLSLAGQQNVLLMHFERGGWPVLAFMLAALLLFRKQDNGEQKTLEMVYKKAPRELLNLLTPLNPQPSQLRYLQYVSRSNVGSDWTPSSIPLTLDYIILKFLPIFGEKGCRPVVRLYGHDSSSSTANRSSKLLFSSDKTKKEATYYQLAVCELVKIDIHQRVQGDVVLECIHLDHVREEMMFRVMFHTTFVRRGLLMLSRDEVDVKWDSQDQMPKNFRAEVLFSDADALPSVITTPEGPTHEEFEVEKISRNMIDGQDGLLPEESRLDAENGDVVLKEEPKPEADVFEDPKFDDENKKPEADKIDGKNSVNSIAGLDGVGKQNVMSGPKEWQHLQKSLKEIEIATKNFQDCIGKGGYGLVYKGKLGNSIPVAVKRLNEKLGQGQKEFLTEVKLLSSLKHQNLISLLGYCEDGNEKILIYEYAQRGSLDKYLRPGNTTCTLTWLERLKICVDAARGLDHLHSHVREHVTIIHRDIKSSNILLDENWVAKISDFGLSKLSFPGFDSTNISHPCGTRGYWEPEYINTGIVKKESDVYSFGMVLFEILCGRLCTFIDSDGFLLSCSKAKQHYHEKTMNEIVDPSLREQLSSDSLNKFSDIAYGCLHEDRSQRPPMDLVLKELEELLKIQDQSVKKL